MQKSLGKLTLKMNGSEKKPREINSKDEQQ